MGKPAWEAARGKARLGGRMWESPRLSTSPVPATRTSCHCPQTTAPQPSETILTLPLWSRGQTAHGHV